MPFTNAADAVNYALSGHATLTMESERTGAHYTFKVDKCDSADRLFFVSLLTGPEEYNYIGVISFTPRSGRHEFRTTAKSTLTNDSLPVVALRWIWRHLTERDQLPPDCTIRHDGTCGKCGRQLTTPRSIDLGIGPECAKKMGIEQPIKKKRSAEVIPLSNTKIEVAPSWLG